MRQRIFNQRTETVAMRISHHRISDPIGLDLRRIVR